MEDGASQGVMLGARPTWKPHLATLAAARPLITDWLIWACFGVWVGWVAVKFLAFHVSGLGVFGDTSVFVGMAKIPWTSLDLWGGERPPTGALFFRVVGGNLEWVTRLYFGAAVICWTALAAVVAYVVRVRWLAFLGFALILAFALTSPIILWDRDALDESASTSMLALTVAAAIWMLAKPTVASLIVLFLVTAWWVLSRDTNAYLILFSAIALLPAAVLVQGYRGHLLVLAGLFVACFLASSWSADHAQRWVFALLNVIGIRVLPDPTLLSYFASHGMPVNPAVRSMAGQYASGKDNAFYHDPQLHSLYVWVVMHGKDVYVQYLITHPFVSLQSIWDQLGALMVEGLGNYLPNNFHPVSRWLDADLFPQDQMRLGLLCGGALAAAAVVWLIRAGDRRLLIPLWMLATTLPMAAVVWYGEGGMEDSRHQLATMIQMRLGAWLILLFAVDAILVARRSIANTSRSRENEDRRTTPTSAST